MAPLLYYWYVLLTFERDENGNFVTVTDDKPVQIESSIEPALQ